MSVAEVTNASSGMAAAAAGVSSLLLRAYRQMVAVDCSHVRELTTGIEVTPVPRMPARMRGVFNWRGRIVPCIDLRRRLGLPAAEEEIEELVGIITARAADHLEWMEELFRSVEERRPFTKTTDPHACAFGRWYDNFRTDNLVVSALRRKMDAPRTRQFMPLGSVSSS